MSAAEKTRAGGGAPACRACGHATAGARWRVRERMLGLGGDFEYGECARCGALSIAEVPADLARYYPPDYAAFTVPQRRPPRATWRGWLFGYEPHRLLRRVMALVPERDARILDVGTGNGALLHWLAGEGYRRLEGIDPHLPGGAEQTEPFALRRGGIGDCSGEWDVIMYHHVLEHVADPREELRAAAVRLAPGGRLIVRVPLADSWARRRFGACWVQWDAPRHLWVPTRAAMSELGAEAGLRLGRTIDDSTNFQRWASERYECGRSFTEPQARLAGRRRLLAAAPRLAAGVVWAHWLNARHRGDQAAFVFQKPGR